MRCLRYRTYNRENFLECEVKMECFVVIGVGKYGLRNMHMHITIPYIIEPIITVDIPAQKAIKAELTLT